MLRTIVQLTMICVLVVLATIGSADPPPPFGPPCYRLVSGGTCNSHGDWFESTPCSGCDASHQCGVRVYTNTLSEEEWGEPKGVWDVIDQEGEGPEGYTEKTDRQRDCVKFGTCKVECKAVPDPNDPFGGDMWVCDENDPQSTLWIDDDLLSGVPCEVEFE